MTKKGKVVDIFSRSAMDEERQDTKANDRLTEEQGHYIGSIHKDNADILRNRMRMLSARSTQIEAMIKQFEVDYRDHFAEMAHILHLLGMDGVKFDPRTQDIMISENGDLWIIDLPKDNGRPLN